MLKVRLIILAVQIVMWLIMTGIGIWYLHSSIQVGEANLPYASLPRFLESIGACENGICDIASASGCFLCPYVQKLFLVISQATEILWNAIIGNTWVLLVLGLAVFMFWQAYTLLMDASKDNAKLDAGERKLDFSKWWGAVKTQTIRVMFVGALLGAAGIGGTRMMQATADTVVYPVMMVGTTLSMAATGMGADAICGEAVPADHALASVTNSFTCVIGNLNATVLAGAGSGFAMMNVAWQGLGGGFFTWIAGLVVVLIFISIGFKVLFKVMNIVFNLVFIIIFLPLLVASFAFEKTWSIAGAVSGNALGILSKTAVRVVGITIEVMILSGMVSYARESTMSSDPMAEYTIIEKCEKMSTLPEGKLDKNIYKECFYAERAANPSAFRYLDNGWDFLVSMLFIFLVYNILIEKKLQEKIDTSDKDAYFKFGDNLKQFGKVLFELPMKIVKKIPFKK